VLIDGCFRYSVLGERGISCSKCVFGGALDRSQQVVALPASLCEVARKIDSFRAILQRSNWTTRMCALQSQWHRLQSLVGDILKLNGDDSSVSTALMHFDQAQQQ
jgi:hypothetical protein